MLTHYVKVRKHDRLTPLESSLYAALPIDRLVVKDEVRSLYEAQKNRFVLNSEGLYNVLTDLVKKGFVKEIYGMRLERFVDTL